MIGLIWKTNIVILGQHSSIPNPLPSSDHLGITKGGSAEVVLEHGKEEEEEVCFYRILKGFNNSSWLFFFFFFLRPNGLEALWSWEGEQRQPGWSVK